MELRDYIAILGLSYGIASDLIGDSARVEANSVSGLVWRWLKALWCRVQGKSAPALVKPTPATKPNYAHLIELGYHYRRHLLKQAGVQAVDVALMGTTLVLTVHHVHQCDA